MKIDDIIKAKKFLIEKGCAGQETIKFFKVAELMAEYSIQYASDQCQKQRELILNCKIALKATDRGIKNTCYVKIDKLESEISKLEKELAEQKDIKHHCLFDESGVCTDCGRILALEEGTK